MSRHKPLNNHVCNEANLHLGFASHLTEFNKKFGIDICPCGIELSRVTGYSRYPRGLVLLPYR